MSFGHHTPESLLPRSDSKNPATTCKGITTNGRPCRRALAQSSSPTPSPSRGNGVLAVLDDESSIGSSTAAFYCWQHKDQAENLAASNTQKTRLVPLKERSSLDTIVDRIGVMNLDDEVVRKKRRHGGGKRDNEPLLLKRDTLPSGWHDMQSPLMTVPEDVLPPRTRPQQRSSPPRSNLKASFLCCLRGDDDDLPPPRRHHEQRKRRPSQPNSTQPQTDRVYDNLPDRKQPSQPTMAEVSQDSKQISRKPVPPTSRPPLAQPPATARITISNPRRPRVSSSQPSQENSKQFSSGDLQTQTLLSWIPAQLAPVTTSLLLSELAKPISPADEAGYIYVFWLTPESDASKPDDDTASNLMEPLTTSHNARERSKRESEALDRYASKRRGSRQPRTILLKIGRAANVHRRLTQWTRQCGKNITLIRYYPYTTDSTAAEPSQSTVLKVPHVHRVERLVHLEISNLRVKDQGACDSCSKEHREWFEIPATREGLRTVDEVVRRWVSWAETQ